ncbi:MAG: tRNA uridine-5-carboxymethylaminomethyl(34) synthesis enzyme MnmG [Lachnospiraceae bacterium]|nr:tRNA uridine-5-carboxymethylaminomethyl(34) synthesis enzyme MnmG [Lachnospiraceae bacterium]
MAGATINTDICIIGAGHAGCEAALACARLGFDTVVFTVSADSIALMPCNPNIGGSSKGHLVREIDAMGGEMGHVIDRTFIQSRMLGTSKGPAVHSLRAQADKSTYSHEMRHVLENQENLTIKQAEVSELLVEDGKVTGVRIYTGITYMCRACVICSGVYLNARCLCGEAITYTGPNGLMASTHFSASLEKAGVKLRRFKTGTPARMDGKTVDFSKCVEQKGDDRVIPFSFDTDPAEVQKPQRSCYLTYTNEKTHEIIRANLDRSPIYAGIIEGTGPRYCPSIEDKVVKFASKDRHQVFLEPEGDYTDEIYVDGMSSSMPEDVQLQMYRTVPGLENVKIVRNAYAIEYDCLCPGQLDLSLAIKNIKGLYSAGQFNGSSGYEEAAAQGLIAGINAVRYLQDREPIIIRRDQGYIGVLIDDLVTKENTEPYRMMTSRAEYRLLLRQDNADLRLRAAGHEAGLVSDEKYEKTLKKEKMILDEMDRLDKTVLGANQKVNSFLSDNGSSPLKTGSTLSEVLARPEMTYEILSAIDEDRPDLPEDVQEQVSIGIKYRGYIEREMREVKSFKKMENRLIPDDIDYDDVLNLRIEARQNLKKLRPHSVGQAMRTTGVSPADISVLLVYLKAKNPDLL